MASSSSWRSSSSSACSNDQDMNTCKTELKKWLDGGGNPNKELNKYENTLGIKQYIDDRDLAYFAVDCEHIECLKLLIGHGANLNRSYNRANRGCLLQLAIYNEDEDSLDLMLRHGADPNILAKLCLSSNKDKRETLAEVISRVSFADNLGTMFEILLQHGLYAVRNKDVKSCLLPVLQTARQVNVRLNIACMFHRFIL